MASNIITGGSFQSFPEAIMAIDEPNPKQTAIGIPKIKNAIPKQAKIKLVDIFQSPYSLAFAFFAFNLSWLIYPISIPQYVRR